MLSRIVGSLQARGTTLAASLLYVSDHGESLGEAGLYLHGIPYAIAPATQTHVPMIAWISPARAADGIDLACARGLVNGRYSHDNLFDTALGLLEGTLELHDFRQVGATPLELGSYQVSFDGSPTPQTEAWTACYRKDLSDGMAGKTVDQYVALHPPSNTANVGDLGTASCPSPSTWR